MNLENEEPCALLPEKFARVRFRVVDNSIEPPFNPIARLSPSSLAYVGDAVYELYVRSYYLLPPKRIGRYHDLVVAQVRAETQAAHLRAIAPLLDEFERELARKGRNAANRGPKRLDPAIYQQATSLETLLGYLYLKHPQRLNELLGQLKLD